MAEIATALVEGGNRAQAADLFRQAVDLVRAEFRRDTSSLWELCQLFEVAALLGEGAACETLVTDAAKLDPIWRSWLDAAVASVLSSSNADRSRITVLSNESLDLVRTAMKEGVPHGERVRAEAAGYLAAAGAVEQAIAMAEEIGDAGSQREAFALVAKALLKANRRADARPLLMRALSAGKPRLSNTLQGMAQAAKWLARTGERDRALAAIESVIKQADALEFGDELIGVRLAALDTFEQCGLPDRASALAAANLHTLVDTSVTTYDYAQRSDAFYAAGRLIPEAFDSALAGIINWRYRRSISRGVLKALLERGERDRAQQFVDALAAERGEHPPFDERPRVDALARIFEFPDARHREWVLNAAASLESIHQRAVLLAHASRALAGEASDQGKDLARSALDNARALEDTAERDLALQEIVGILSPTAASALITEALSIISDTEKQDDMLAASAEAFARRGDAATAAEMLAQMGSINRRNDSIDAAAGELFAARQYDAGRALLDLLSSTLNFKKSYGTAQAAAALARDGEPDRAAALLSEGMGAARQSGDPQFGLITARLALAAARLSRPEVARKLAAQAQEEDDWSFGPFVSATVGAVYATLDDAAGTKESARKASEQLQSWDPPLWPWGLSVVGKIWREASVHDVDAFLPLMDATKDSSVQSGLIVALAEIGGPATPSEVMSQLFDKAAVIEEFWSRVSALRALVEPAAAARDRTALGRLLDVVARLDNQWARGELVAALAKNVAPLDDEDLLSSILAQTSAFSMPRWRCVLTLAQTASVFFHNKQTARASELAERVLEIANAATNADVHDRAMFDAEEASRLAILGRTAEAHALVQRVIDKLPAASKYEQGQLLDALDDATEEMQSKDVLLAFATAALAVKSPFAANTARQLARLGHLDAAADIVAQVKNQWPVQDKDDRSSSQWMSVPTLMLLGRRGEALNATLDGLDSGRTGGSFFQPAIYSNLGEALHELGDTAALASMCDTLTNTTQWWER